MKIEPVSEHVGALVRDIDVRSVDDADVAALVDAWGTYGVLFFQGQTLTPEEHIAFAERFAPIDVNKFFGTVDGYPQIAQVLKEPDQDKNIGGGWHTDHSYDTEPAWGSILLARETPPTGGDTMFASVGAAYDALSDGLKATLAWLKVRHSNRHVFGSTGYSTKANEGRINANDHLLSDAVHPAVVLHPVSGRKLLYINPAFTRGFDGWTDEESAPLLQYLFAHMRQDAFTYRFEWAPGSIAMWDNRSTWHNALNDYQGHRRLMHRITIAGTALAGVAV